MITLRISKLIIKLLILASLNQYAIALELEEASRMSVDGSSPAIPTENALMNPAPKLIKIYSPKQELLFSERIRQNQRLVYSDKGEHFAILKYNDHSPTTFSLLDVDVYNLAGKRLWRLNEPNGLSVVLSDGRAAAAVIDGAEGLSLSRVRLYSPDGTERAVIPVTYLFGLGFSGDGMMFFVNSADSGLSAYDSNGAHLYDFGLCRKFAASYDGSIVVTEYEGAVSFFRSGVRIQTDSYDFEEIGALKDIVISDTLKKVFLLYRGAVASHKMPTFENEWTFREIPEGATLTSFDVSADGLIAYGFDIPEMRSGRKAHEKGGVAFLDQSGISLFVHNMIYSTWARDFPMVEFSPSGDAIQIVNRSEALYFNIRR